MLAQAPGVHEEALEAHGVGRKTQPQKVRVDTGELVPDNAQVLAALGHLDAHEALDGLAVAHGVAEAADAADALGHVHEVLVVALLHELLEAAVHEANLRDGLHHALVLKHKVEVHGLGQHGMLGAEGHDGPGCHSSASYSAAAAGLAAATGLALPCGAWAMGAGMCR